MTQMRDLQERRERAIADRKQQQEQELSNWKLQQEREIEEAKEQQRQQGRALREKQQQLEQEEDMLSKEFVPLGQAKLKRSVNEEVRSDTSRAKPVWTRDETGIWRRESPVFDSSVKKTKAELCRDKRLLDVDGLFREDDEQPNRLTDTKVMQQQMREFNRLLAKREKERQEKRSATSFVCGNMGPSPHRLKDVKPSEIDCTGRGAPPAVRSEDLDEYVTLRRALGTVQQLLEKQCGNYNPTLDGVVEKELMKSNLSESKIETKSGVRKTEETDKLERKEDRRKSPVVKPRIFDDSTPVEAFVQQFKACAQYYKWTEEESSVQMKCILSGDAATLV